MAKCPNCGAGMSCGCQRRQLPNGKMGCSKCVHGGTPTTKNLVKKDSVDPTINEVSIEPK